MSNNKIESVLRSIINEQIDRKHLEIKKEDAEKIVIELVPYIDGLIAKQVKKHFVEIGEFISQKFKEGV